MNKSKLFSVLIFILLISLGGITNANERIVSAGGSVTEILFELGLGKNIIAVDSSSTFPLDIQNKPQIGYFRSLSAEGVLALRPTLIAAANGAGPDETLTQIQQAGVKVKVFKQEVYNINAWKNYIREIATYFNVTTRAESVIQGVIQRLSLITETSQSSDLTRAIFLLGLGERGPIAAGKNTVPDMLLNLANINNIVKEYEGFKPYSTEELIKNKPDLIVMPAHVVKKLGGKDQICQSMVIKLATANQGCNLLVMDPLLSLGFGTRIDKAVEVLVSYEY